MRKSSMALVGRGGVVKGRGPGIILIACAFWPLRMCVRVGLLISWPTIVYTDGLGRGSVGNSPRKLAIVVPNACA